MEIVIALALDTWMLTYANFVHKLLIFVLSVKLKIYAICVTSLFIELPQVIKHNAYANLVTSKIHNNCANSV